MAAGTLTNIYIQELWNKLGPGMSIYSSGILKLPIVKLLSSSNLDNGGVYEKLPFRKKHSGTAQSLIAATALTVRNIGNLYDQKCSLLIGDAIGEEISNAERIGESLITGSLPDLTRWYGEQYSDYIYSMNKGIFGTGGALDDVYHKQDQSAYFTTHDIITGAMAGLGNRVQPFGYAVMSVWQARDLGKDTLIHYELGSNIGIDLFANTIFPMVGNCIIAIDDRLPIIDVNGVKCQKMLVGAAGAIEFRINKFFTYPSFDTKAGRTDYINSIARIEPHIPGVRCNQAVDGVDDKNPLKADLERVAFWTKIAEDATDVPLVEVTTKINYPLA